MSTDGIKDNETATEEPVKTDATVNTDQTTPKKTDLGSSATGLTAVFGKPVSTNNDISSVNQQVASEYRQLKHKKLAQSAISTTLGDLLGSPEKSSDPTEEKPSTEKSES